MTMNNDRAAEIRARVDDYERRPTRKDFVELLDERKDLQQQVLRAKLAARKAEIELAKARARAEYNKYDWEDCHACAQADDDGNDMCAYHQEPDLIDGPPEHSPALAEGSGEGLTALERDMLDLAAQKFKYEGIRRDAAARLMARHGHEGATLDIRYSQVLNRLLDRPEAAEYAPGLVARLKAQRAA